MTRTIRSKATGEEVLIVNVGTWAEALTLKPVRDFRGPVVLESEVPAMSKMPKEMVAAVLLAKRLLRGAIISRKACSLDHEGLEMVDLPREIDKSTTQSSKISPTASPTKHEQISLL